MYYTYRDPQVLLLLELPVATAQREARPSRYAASALSALHADLRALQADARAGISASLLTALVVAEDRRYFRHSGVDVIAVLRVLYGFVFGRKLGGAARSNSISSARSRKDGSAHSAAKLAR